MNGLGIERIKDEFGSVFRLFLEAKGEPIIPSLEIMIDGENLVRTFRLDQPKANGGESRLEMARISFHVSIENGEGGALLVRANQRFAPPKRGEFVRRLGRLSECT